MSTVPSSNFINPIIPGFYPDPSICRVGDDYYLVTSSFEFFPGVPIFHSRDLVHWRQLGHVLDRPEQLDLDGINASDGIWAPTIRHHQGRFYLITTLVNRRGGEGLHNFVVTSDNPTGPWSDPVWLPDAPGIDPSLFFDDDGRAYYIGNRRATRPGLGAAQREIWLQELDLASLRLIGERYHLWDGTGGAHAEGPHIYKRDGRYYLLISEGGTHYHHCLTIARADHVSGPYEGNEANPILTHRHLGRDYPISNVGHGDLVETQQGEWWLVALASRPYGSGPDARTPPLCRNLGREVILAPVRWEEGWPIVSPGTGRVEQSSPAPNLPAQRWPMPAACDQFDDEALDPHWVFLRTPRASFWSLGERPGFLRLRPGPPLFAANNCPSMLCRRQQHIRFAARTDLEFAPRRPGETAGMVLFQNAGYHLRLEVGWYETGPALRVFQAQGGPATLLAERQVGGARLGLKVEAHGQEYQFFVAERPGRWEPIGAPLDGRVLSTDRAGGFIGAMIGLYASGDGGPSEAVADFDYFEYQGW